LLNAVQENLLAVDISNVISDILHIEQASEQQLHEAVEAFINASRVAA
jgi:hypothetical protein